MGSQVEVATPQAYCVLEQPLPEPLWLADTRGTAALGQQAKCPVSVAGSYLVFNGTLFWVFLRLMGEVGIWMGHLANQSVAACTEQKA